MDVSPAAAKIKAVKASKKRRQSSLAMEYTCQNLLLLCPIVSSLSFCFAHFDNHQFSARQKKSPEEVANQYQSDPVACSFGGARIRRPRLFTAASSTVIRSTNKDRFLHFGNVCSIFSLFSLSSFSLRLEKADLKRQLDGAALVG
mmetsp:Transcript_17872/g.34904  ORF Transcript_17872/g.34904 Transcript_17872/m.34904 type:complete len:145 (-) Transcript_17872:229-663(-)